MMRCRTKKRALQIGIALIYTTLISFSAIPVCAGQTGPEFAADFVSARDGMDTSTSRVDVYTRIAYSSLSFNTTPNGFTANYRTSLSASKINDTDHLRNLVQTKYWDSQIVTDTYLETQSSDLKELNTQSIILDPGRYVMELELSDENSSQKLVGEFLVQVRDFSNPVSMSDITLLDSYDEENFSIVPRVDSRLTTAEGGLQIFYETYSDEARELQILREVIRVQKDPGVPELSGILDSAVKNAVSTTTVISEEESVVLPKGKSQHLITLSADELKVGTYAARVSLVDPVDGVLDVAEKSFTTLWGGLEEHLLDIENAISQLEYIAKKKDLVFIRSASTESERASRFRDFWNKRDPTPETPRNERMEEYYYRVDSANRQYGAIQDGWKTDRGYIYVTYGEPDYVEKKNHRFDYEPYEVWTYERLGRQFIFVDKTGFGDYQLLLPAWDERTRLY
jgi:GWxTD domain-containing protein